MATHYDATIADFLRGSRRDFLRQSVAAAATLGPLGLIACGDKPQNELVSEEPVVDPLCNGLVADPNVCVDTDDDVLGPYYRAGAPLRTQVADPNEPGDRLLVSGRVLGADCLTPLSNALVEIWQADANGVYSPLTGTDWKLRAQMLSGSAGYGFETIWPGFYAGRPRHIHYRVTYERSPGDVVELITQLYFEHDPFLANDPFVDPSRVTCLSRAGNALQANFDLVLPV